MLEGIHRLEEQEERERKQAKLMEKAGATQPDMDTQSVTTEAVLGASVERKKEI